MRRHLGLWALLVTGCQTYDFERVVPLAVAQTTQRHVSATRRLKPNLMLLVDNSGSMLQPIDKDDSRCAPGCGTVSAPCDAACPTRISELKSSLGEFLGNQPTLARLGLTVFPQPTDSQPCRGAVSVDVPLPAPVARDEGTEATLRAAAAAVNQKLQGLPPGGGTPTAASLAFVGESGGLSDASDGRADYVVLLTDGLPNCRDASPVNVCDCGASCAQARIDACACTQQSCTDAARCSLGCLDEGGAVAQVAALRARGIQTIVVGFGAEVATGDGPRVLSAMAAAGGLPRACPGGTSAECGGGACEVSTFTCAQAFYAARNGGELSVALDVIKGIVEPRPCEFQLDARPSDPRYLSVVLEGRTLQPGPDTYRYDFQQNVVTFEGLACAALSSTTPEAPLSVEFRIAEVL